MSFSSGVYFGNHSTMSQCARAARAARESLLTWIGPLSSTNTTGLVARPGIWAIKSIDLLEMRHQVAGALGRTGMHNQFVRYIVNPTESQTNGLV
jgi:hypothetical protein